MANGIFNGYVIEIYHNRRCKSTELVQLFRPIVFILCLSTILPNTHAAFQPRIETGPSPDFRSHSIVKPRVYHARQKREIIHTRINDFEHADAVTVVLELGGEKRTLDLQLNTDLIPVGYKQRSLHNGVYEVENPERIELCHYQGRIRNVPDSWAAVSTCRGLRGVVYDGKNTYHIDPQQESLDNFHYIYKQSDLITDRTCGFDGTSKYNTISSNITKFRKKRAMEVIHGPHNANRQSRYVELVLVIDKKEYIALGENIDKVHHHCKDIANIINALYTPLNIFVALVGVEVWTDNDAISLSPKGDTTLGNFLRYRREMLVKAIPNDNAQLLTRIHFEDGVVGKALKGPICTYEFSGGVSMDHSNVIGLVAATVAHEMGHNFGMEHDSPDCSCPEDRCIMAPSSGSTGPTHWSSCSLEYLALAFEHGMDYCLRNKPKKLFDSPMCGNGFVESGEQCDCGLEENCDNSCCNATTCMLHLNASCATGECCDLKTCKPKNAGTECRTAEHECDLPEYCTGQSEYCPKDVFKIDGEVCSMGKAFCYQGSCRTHNDQCKLLWGPTGFSSDAQCYNMNSKGTKHGNCGYNRLDSSYIKCDDENILCGMLHCKHLNERLEFGMESVAILSHSFINNGGKIIACRSAIVDLGLNQVDPGLAPDGAKCAPGKMCVNQKCMPIADLRSSVNGGSACWKDCGGNGVCNSLGHCHCNRGFRPPDCIQPGFGGSDDSGPAEDPNGGNDFVTALYIIFLGIVPTIALVSLAVWYKRNNSTHHSWKKESISTHDRGFTIKTIDRPPHQRHTGRVIETIDSTLNPDSACTSLLPKIDSDERFNNDLFGKFKGFTLSPLSSVTEAPRHPDESNKNDFVERISTTATVSTIRTITMKNNKKLLERSNIMESAFMLQPMSSITLNMKRESDDVHLSDQSALPQLNSRCIEKSSISSPILSATTCTSLEFVEAKIPTRPAPGIPARLPDALSDNEDAHNKTPEANKFADCKKNSVDKEKDRERSEKSTTLNRITSILKTGNAGKASNCPVKPEEMNFASRNQHHKATKVIDKEILRNLEISNPIPQNEIKISAPTIPLLSSISLDDDSNESTNRKSIVTRAQSLKSPDVTSRPIIQTFGSMRQSNKKPFQKRPTSNPINVRPKSPPPPVPSLISSANSVFIDEKKKLKIPGLPGYQNPPIKINQQQQQQLSPTDSAYDDCMNLIQESSLNRITEEISHIDNIYAVIEDSHVDKTEDNVCQMPTEYKVPIALKSVKMEKIDEKYSNGADNGSAMGLLSEIVSEISNRNFDSIYSASASSLIREKQNEESENIQKQFVSLPKPGDIHAGHLNANDYKAPVNIYTNSALGNFDSTASETSSGYLLPSAVNVPKTSNTLPGSINVLDKAAPNITDPRISESEISRSLEMKKIKNINISNKCKEMFSNNERMLKASPKYEQGTVLPNVPVDRSQSMFIKDQSKSPDVVSSCSSSTSMSFDASASPDIVINNPRVASSDSNQLEIRNSKYPLKSSSGVATKKIIPSLLKSKVTPTGTQNQVTNHHRPVFKKELNDSSHVAQQSSVDAESKKKKKSTIKSKSNLVQKVAGGKSNVASLQLIFEENKTVTTDSAGSMAIEKSDSRKAFTGSNVKN